MRRTWRSIIIYHLTNTTRETNLLSPSSCHITHHVIWEFEAYLALGILVIHFAGSKNYTITSRWGLSGGGGGRLFSSTLIPKQQQRKKEKDWESEGKESLKLRSQNSTWNFADLQFKRRCFERQIKVSSSFQKLFNHIIFLLFHLSASAANNSFLPGSSLRYSLMRCTDSFTLISLSISCLICSLYVDIVQFLQLNNCWMKRSKRNHSESRNPGTESLKASETKNFQPNFASLYIILQCSKLINVGGS
jgi:hypothetical protein